MKGATAGIWNLTEPLGHGGMAEVWRGVAADSDDVAIKLMPHARKLESAFQTEAAALARLVHPRIIRILDFGLCDTGSANVPFLALELARGPALDRWVANNPVRWADVLHITRTILEALAHAHARGLVHRDIKPANILAMDTAAKDWRLTDFGIAHTAATGSDEYRATGTPRYMAPEQFRGKYHEQGPWTDLYALGCVLFELVHGAPPFDDPVPLNLAMAHLNAPPPELVPRLQVPPGFAELVATLLRKDPLSRFRCAADVRAALDRLPRVHELRAAPPADAAGIAPTLVTPTLRSTSIINDVADLPWSPTHHGAPDVPLPAMPIEPPETSPRHYFATFHGDTGPGLIGLRELPFVGRVRERRRIWEHLRDAVAGHLRTVAILGPPGIGKSAIGRWLTQAVQEYGIAMPIRVDSAREVHDALLDALIRAYRLDVRSESQLRTHLERWALAPDWAVSALVSAATGGTVAADDVIDAVLAAVWAHARERPVVLWLDDVDDVPGWARVLQKVGGLVDRDAPVFVVYAARRRSEQLLEYTDDVIELPPFAPGETGELITELVGVSVDEAFEIAHLVDGQPQLAVEVVREWIDAGLLERKEGRWTLHSRAHRALPKSASDLRRRTVDAALRGRAADREALELLACVGHPCSPQFWHEANGVAGVVPSGSLLATAVRSNIVESRDGRLKFVDAVTRRTLMADAEERGTASRYHAAIAQVLTNGAYEATAASLGGHLMRAGRPADALPWLLEAMDALRVGDNGLRMEVEPLLRGAVEALGLEDEEPGWRLRFYVLRSGTLRSNSGLGRQESMTVIQTARERGWVRLECQALTAAAHYLSARSPVAADRELATRAVELADSLDDLTLRLDSRSAAGAMFGYLGELDESMRHYTAARTLATEAGDDGRWLADADYGIGWVYFLRGANDAALTALDRAFDGMRRSGRTRQAYAVLAFRGDVLRALGRLDEADATYTEAYRYFSRYHLTEGVLPANFALLEVARGCFDDAVRWARRSREIEGEHGRAPILRLASAIEVLHAAHQRDVDRWDDEFEVLAHEFGADSASVDIAYVADAAARETAGKLDSGRARLALQLAISLWQRLGRDAEAKALAELL